MVTIKFKTYPDLREEILPMYMGMYNTTDVERITELVEGEFYGNKKAFKEEQELWQKVQLP